MATDAPLDDWQYETVAVVGVGLLGGSIGLALQQRHLARRVVGIGRNEERLRQAVAWGVVSEATVDLKQGVAEADLVIVCTPVERIVPYVREIATYLPPHALITDVGSTKAAIVSQLSDLAPPEPVNEAERATFVGSHPLAGSEKTGAGAAQATLLDDRVVVVTPHGPHDSAAVASIVQFWELLGARVLLMESETHDRAVAASSHLPHLVASALAAATPQDVGQLVSSGWSDTTRIAAGDPELWRQILVDNRSHVLKSLDNFAKVLASFRDALTTDDQAQLLELLEAGKKQRDTLGG